MHQQDQHDAVGFGIGFGGGCAAEINERAFFPANWHDLNHAGKLLFADRRQP